MKKLNCVLFLVLAASFSIRAQAPLGKGGIQLNAGTGFSGFGVPIYVGADFGVHDDITIGPKISHRSYGYSVNGNDLDQTLTYIGFNGNYHFNRVFGLPDEWNVYAGATLGYFIWSSSDLNGAKSSGLAFGAQVGGRYFFTEKFGINLELGGGSASEASFGITYRFK